MRMIAMVCAVVLLLTPPLHAGEGINVGISGTCVSVAIGGKPVRCNAKPFVLYTALPNGRVLYNVALSDGRVMAFVGESDKQPRPEEYWLYLTRVRIAQGPQNVSSDVAGTCRMYQTSDGSVVHRILCEATDLSGSKFLLDFRGNGQRVEMLPF